MGGMLKELLMSNHDSPIRSSLVKIDQLCNEDKTADAIELALQAGQTWPDDKNVLRAIGLLLISKNWYSEFEIALNMLEKCLSDFPNDPAVYHAYAYACWRSHRKEGALMGSLRTIALAPKMEHGYIRLGMHYLTEGQYTEAFITFAAGAACCQNNRSLLYWRKLAEALMKNIKVVKLEFDGKPFAFGISAHNGQAMETAGCHIHGTLAEAEELRFLRGALGRCDTIVECGILVGNHLVYFMKTLSPRKIIAFDADSWSIAETNRNIELNRDDGITTEVELHHKVVSNVSGPITFDGQTLEGVALSEAVTEPVDFIKVDVDGMELELIEGAWELIKRTRPKILIEVRKEYIPDFLKRMETIHYRVEHSFDRPHFSNVFLVPADS